MMQAITTKYLGPTNKLGSRIKAQSASGIYKTFGYKSELSSEANHEEAARSLAKRLGWNYNLIGGSLDNERCVFVLVERVK